MYTLLCCSCRLLSLKPLRHDVATLLHCLAVDRASELWSCLEVIIEIPIFQRPHCCCWVSVQYMLLICLHRLYAVIRHTSPPFTTARRRWLFKPSYSVTSSSALNIFPHCSLEFSVTYFPLSYIFHGMSKVSPCSIRVLWKVLDRIAQWRI